MRQAAALLLALVIAGCGGSSSPSSSSGPSSSAPPRASSPKRAVPERSAALPRILGVAGRYVDRQVASGALPPVHPGRAGVVGGVAVVYLVGGSDVAGGGGPPVKGTYGVLVLAKSGGTWQVKPPVVRLQARS